jgi:ribosomal-protein-alanine N-acetyltransferase
MKHAFIVGEKVYLRGLSKEDLSGKMFDWAHDKEVTHYMYTGIRPNTIEAMEAEYRTSIECKKDVVFAICDKQTDLHIGNAGLYDFNSLTHSAEYRIIIGEKEYWSKGIGAEVNALVLDYGFNKMNLNKVWLGVNAENKGAHKSYLKSGFIEEGKLRQEIYRNGQYYDAIRMSVLRSEFYAR